MDMSTIGAVWTSFRAAKDAGKALLELKIDTEVRLKVSEMLDRFGEIQDKLFKLREDLDTLQAENHELREQLTSMNDWKSRLEKYSLVNTGGGAVVYQSTFEPMHYACPSCIENKNIHILQDTNTYGGSFVCPKCDKHFPIRKPRKPPRRQATISTI
jgi:ssDNA-binding Zn-finger/Zn-ribbon topoisomerase 1